MTKIKNSSSFPTLLGSFENSQEFNSYKFLWLITLMLVLTLYGVSAHAVGASDPSSSTIDNAVPELFLPRVTARSALEKHVEVGREPIQFNRKLAKLSAGGEARLSLPFGGSYVLNFDNRFDHPSGNVTWVGSLQGYGDDYRAVITFGEGGASGTIHTPDGDFLVETDADGEWLVDPKAAGLTPEGPGIDDALIPIPEEAGQPLSPENFSPFINDGGGTSGNSEDMSLYKNLAVAAADTTPVTIDLMILYTPGFASGLGSGLSARLDQLVALSNQAYRDSGVYIELRLVHKQQVEYSETTSNSTALNAVTTGSDPALANVASLRDTYGADLVTLIRPFDRNTAGSCGIAWIGGSGGQPISNHARYGYSVVSNGRDVSGTATYCLDLTFVHELGHNMGSMHDRASVSSGSGAYPYSYGYGISGVFGTIMSYISPRVGKFSNPDITCSGSIACGISETALDSANNALSLNNTRAGVAGFRPTQVNLPPTSYALTVSKSGSGTVSSTPSGIDCGSDCTEDYDSDTSVTLTATPDTGATFTGWSGDCTGTAETCTVTMSAAQSVTATFTDLDQEYSLTVSKSGSGTVSSTPSGIDCGTVCRYQFSNSTEVTLSATPASDYTFDGWSGACTGTGACTVTMDATKNVTAIFKAISKYTLTVSRRGSGVVTSDVAGINCGSDCSESYPSDTAVTLTATPANGYYFGGWSGACTGTDACTVTLSAAQTVIATFKANPILMVRRIGNGTVSSDVAGIDCGSDCKESYSNGTTVTLTATPASDYTFNGWSGACTGTSTCTVTMDVSKNVVATFKAIPKYALRISRRGGGTVSSDVAGVDCGRDCSESYLSGTVVTLTATPATGYYFGGWGGACTGTDACTVTLSAAQTVIATFKANPVLAIRRIGNGTVSSDVAGIDCGSDCRESHLSGTVVTLTATPASGYTFAGWSGACTGTDDCIVTMDAAKSVMATFKAIPKYALRVYRSGSGAVSSDVAGISCGSDCVEPYPSGAVVTLTATPIDGYYFSGWSSVCTGTGDCAVTMDAARIITAIFKINS